MRKYFLICSLFVLLVLLSGCTKRELEDRYFPLAMELHNTDGAYRVEYAMPNMGEETGQVKGGNSEDEKEKKDTKEESSAGNTVEEACKEYQEYVDKYMDTGHIKAIILGTEILKNPQYLKDTLEYFESHAVFARSTLIFAYEEEEQESLVSLTASNQDSLGTYLENLIMNNPNRKEEKKITLGDLLGFWHNQEEKIKIPLIYVKNNKPVREKDFVIKNIINAD